jgi:hypothetical protein
VTITAVADIPDLDVQVLPGEEVNQIVLRVTATQTDADSSEFMDRIATSVAGGLPAGSTITPGSSTRPPNRTRSPGFRGHRPAA